MVSPVPPRTRACGGWVRRVAAAVSTATTVAWIAAVPVGAQIDNPAVDASAPGAALVGKLLGWLKWMALAAALAGLLIGAITTAVGHFGSNYSASSAGRKWVLGGVGAAILAALSWTIVTTLYNTTAGG